MNYRGYPEQDLVSNRSSLLLYGGNEAERRLWAEEAAQGFEAEGPLRVAHTGEELAAALQPSRGVVFIPEVGAVGHEAQRQLVTMLRQRDERPKVIVGLQADPDTRLDAGALRNELHYALQMAHVNLDWQGVREAIRTRRAKKPTPKAVSRPAPKPAAKARKAAPAAKARKAAPAAKARKAAPAAKSRKAQPRKATAKSSKPASSKSAKKPAARRRR